MLSTTPCKHCGNDTEPTFFMHKLFTTYRENIFVLMCSECKQHGESVPFAAPFWESFGDTDERAKKLWSEANMEKINGAIQGWRFYSADFSTQAAQGMHHEGTVMLMRDPESKIKWHRMPEEIKERDDCPALYVSGKGRTFEEALRNANNNASLARPIVEPAE